MSGNIIHINAGIRMILQQCDREGGSDLSIGSPADNRTMPIPEYPQTDLSGGEDLGNTDRDAFFRKGFNGAAKFPDSSRCTSFRTDIEDAGMLCREGFRGHRCVCLIKCQMSIDPDASNRQIYTAQ